MATVKDLIREARTALDRLPGIPEAGGPTVNALHAFVALVEALEASQQRAARQREEDAAFSEEYQTAKSLKRRRQDYVVDRWNGGTSAGHFGTPGYKPVDDYDQPIGNATLGGITPDVLFDRSLPSGTKLRVRVEILDEPNTLEKADRNPWHNLRKTPWCSRCQDDAGAIPLRAHLLEAHGFTLGELTDMTIREMRATDLRFDCPGPDASPRPA